MSGTWVSCRHVSTTAGGTADTFAAAAAGAEAGTEGSVWGSGAGGGGAGGAGEAGFAAGPGEEAGAELGACTLAEADGVVSPFGACLPTSGCEGKGGSAWLCVCGWRPGGAEGSWHDSRVVVTGRSAECVRV